MLYKDESRLLLIPAAMSGIAIFPLPYAYYEALRAVMWIGAAMVAWSLYKPARKANWQVLAFIAVAILCSILFSQYT